MSKKRHHRRLLARLRAMFPRSVRRKVVVRRVGCWSWSWEVFVPARTFHGKIVVVRFNSYGSETRLDALRDALARRTRGLSENGWLTHTLGLARLQRDDGDLPLPWFTDEDLSMGSEYDV